MALCSTPLALASPFEVPDVDPEENLELKTTIERRTGEWDVPELELTFPVRPRVEASIEAAYAIEETQRGLSDVELNAKWQFVRTERTRLTLQPAITFDTADDLGEDEHVFELGLIGARSFGAFELDGRVGYERSFDGEEDAYFGSALLLYDVAEDVRVGAELAATDADALASAHQPRHQVGSQRPHRAAGADRPHDRVRRRAARSTRVKLVLGDTSFE